ncbi:ribonuclease T [Candidatus Berkiella aquae]|uniref:Ribonuclease T n=1 Tax=Candidatus Berkiella aquae TaxID=295108 RepID=A0A0Q9YXJ8_9GAMM|nr:ribonuclease T [Candidatus Berkiella aquae]MCS5710945.1 ribonuclease T [Candidatus Berkiella aquae]
MESDSINHLIKKRFRGFLPVVIDVETGGLEPKKDALLELAAITIEMNEQGFVFPAEEFHYHILPFENANLDPKSLAFNKIDPLYPLRFAIDEKDAMKDLCIKITQACKKNECQRAVLVGHNAWFDQHFLNAAMARSHMVKNPFHRFTSFDTATLGGLAFGQTVLSKALGAANIPYDSEEAHSALYDAQRTAELFCHIVNQWKITTEPEQAPFPDV